MFIESFREIVVEPVRTTPAYRTAWQNTVCGGARAAFDRMGTALCYCMCWQYMHFESLSSILARGHTDDYIAPLVIDVGAGPATVAAALAQRSIERHDQTLSLGYVGVELYGPMRDIGDQFLQDNSLFDVVDKVWLEQIDDLSPNVVEPVSNGCDALIFACSYILRQPHVDTGFAERLARGVARVRSHWPDLPAYFLYQDVSGGDRSNIYAFLDELRRNGYYAAGKDQFLRQDQAFARLDGGIDRRPHSGQNEDYRNVHFRFDQVRVQM